MIRFLLKSWVYPFYRTYAGFLFVVFLFAAGLLKGEEHVAIAKFFTSDVKNLAYPYFGLLLYEFLTLHFSIRWISDQKNMFLWDLVYIPGRPRTIILGLIILYLHIPVIAYSLFLLGMALVSGQIMVSIVIILGSIFKLAIFTFILFRFLLFPVEKKYNQIFRIALPGFLNFPVIVFSIRHFFSKSFLSFFLSKTLSIGTLMVFILLIQTIDNYERFASVAITLIFISNAFLSYELFKFQNIDLNVFRNLPLKPLIILFQSLMIMIILNLPEILIIYRNFSGLISIWDLIMDVLNGLMVLLFLFAYLVFYHIGLQQYITRIFWGSILLVLFLLFDFPSYLLFIAFSSASAYLYMRGYYNFETVYY